MCWMQIHKTIHFLQIFFCGNRFRSSVRSHSGTKFLSFWWQWFIWSNILIFLCLTYESLKKKLFTSIFMRSLGWRKWSGHVSFLLLLFYAHSLTAEHKLFLYDFLWIWNLATTWIHDSLNLVELNERKCMGEFWWPRCSKFDCTIFFDFETIKRTYLEAHIISREWMIKS